MRRWVGVLAAAGAVAILNACDGEPAKLVEPGVGSVTIAPASDSVRVAETLRLTATALNTRGEAIAGAQFVWRSLQPSIATVDGTGLVRGVAPGSATIEASHGGIAATATVRVAAAPVQPMVEARALWLSRFDWTNAGEITSIIGQAAQAGFNIIYFQVRGTADAFYVSAHEPWAQRLGRLGQNPGWDPLRVAVDAAQANGLEIHAWINAFPGWQGQTPPSESTPRHAFLTNPEWAMVAANGTTMPYSSDYRWLSPGHPGVRERLAAVAADIVRSYTVSGVHLDYIRYPSPEYSYDSASLAGFDDARVAEPGLNFAEFRRRQVTEAVRLVGDSVRAIRPAARLSAAVWGIYLRPPSWPTTGCALSTGHGDRLQDARAWVNQGIIDAVVPMVYWSVKERGACLDFRDLANDHATAITGRHVYIGITAQTFDLQELTRQVEAAREAGAEGVSFFSARLLIDRGLMQQLRSGVFQRPASIPPMPWKPGP
jgi:uncharacterized lipoprotein YddW (UPF0748 family)